jgi:hypothetical protein
MQKVKIQLSDYSLVSTMKMREILFNFTPLENSEAFIQAKLLCNGEAIVIPNAAFLDILESLKKEFNVSLSATIIP